jgi:hypothetical protein
MNTAIRTQKTAITAALFLLVVLISGAAFAIDEPPPQPQQLRTWLVGHLLPDMEALGTFSGSDLANVPAVVNTMTDVQVAVLAQYYYLTRSKADQDAYFCTLHQSGYSDAEVNVAKAQVADVLTMINNQLAVCCNQLAVMPQPVQYVAQLVYASVPGWCCNSQRQVPEVYYNNGCFVGPCFNAVYAGVWAVPVCNAYFDHGSRFYARYHTVAKPAHINRSEHLTKRPGDWRDIQAHNPLIVDHRKPTDNRPAERVSARRSAPTTVSRSFGASHPSAQGRVTFASAATRPSSASGSRGSR